MLLCFVDHLRVKRGTSERGIKEALKTLEGLCQKKESGWVFLFMRAVNPQTCGAHMHTECLLCKIWWWSALKNSPPTPPDSQTSARTQPGHYVNAKGSLMPVKFECEIPDICGSVPEAVPSEADKSAEGKGITSSSVFAQNCFQWKGQSRIPQDLFTRPRHFGSGGVEAEFGKMEQSLHKSQVITGKKRGSFTTWGEEKLSHCWWKTPSGLCHLWTWFQQSAFLTKPCLLAYPQRIHIAVLFFNQMGPFWKERF